MYGSASLSFDPIDAAPKVEVPKVEVPKVEVPKVEAPKAAAPKAAAPKAAATTGAAKMVKALSRRKRKKAVRSFVDWSPGTVVDRKYVVCGAYIGRGDSAICYKVCYRHSPAQYVVLKVLHVGASKRHQEDFDAEALLMRGLPRHRNIVQFHRMLAKPQQHIIVLQYCPGGSVKDYLSWRPKGCMPRARSWLRQLLEALRHLHAHNIAHRDVKTGNLLLSRDAKHVLLADFGLAARCAPDARLTRLCGTPNYLSPETLKQDYGVKADLWSAGIVAYFVWTGVAPFRSRAAGDVQALFDNIECLRYRVPDFVPAPAAQLCRRLLCKEAVRCTATEALAAPYFHVSPPQKAEV
jgi:myosin-1